MGKRGPKVGEVTERARQGAAKGGSASKRTTQDKALAVPQGGLTETTPQRWLAPDGTSPYGKRLWKNLWEDDLATNFHEADKPALHAWLKLNDRLRGIDVQLSRMETEQTNIITGSAGQLQMHPYYAEGRNLRREIRALEKEFGMTPASRANIMHTTAETMLTAQQLNDMVRADSTESGSPVTDVIDVEGWE